MMGGTPASWEVVAGLALEHATKAAAGTTHAAHVARRTNIEWLLKV
jgi:hypothetical protein